MNTGSLVGAVLRGALGVRRKRSRRALDFLVGRRSGPATADLLMTAAGLAWGAYEAWQAGAAGRAPATGGTPSSAPVPEPPAQAQTAASGDDATMRLLRLAVAAANADGSLAPAEQAAIAAQAGAAGASPALVAQLASPAPLDAIVAGVTDPREAATLYVLAFTIVRADEQVSGTERIFLAQLANVLGLAPSLVTSLEQGAGTTIDQQR